MTVSATFARTSDGAPTALPQHAGSISPGNTSSGMDFYIRHDGTNPITNVRFYLLPYSAGVYLGTTTAQDDYDKVIGWGDTSGAGSHGGGGLYLSQNHSGGFAAATFNQFRTGYGDTLGNAISLTTSAINIGAAVAGEIASGGEAHIRLRVDVPAAETDTGTFYVDMLMAYSSTS